MANSWHLSLKESIEIENIDYSAPTSPEKEQNPIYLSSSYDNKMRPAIISSSNASESEDTYLKQKKSKLALSSNSANECKAQIRFGTIGSENMSA